MFSTMPQTITGHQNYLRKTCQVSSTVKTTGKTTISYTASNQHGIRQWSKTSNTTDGYASKVANGEMLPHQYFRYSTRENEGPAGRVVNSNGTSIVVHSGGQGGNLSPYGGYIIANPNEASEIASLRAQLDTALLLKVKSQKLNIANLIAERDQTLRLFVTTARKLTEAAVLLKRGKWAQAGRTLGGVSVSRRATKRLDKYYAHDRAKAIANAWIELQYGWKPLISEARGAAEALARHHARMRTVIAKSKKSLNTTYISKIPKKLGSLEVGDAVCIVKTTIELQASVLFRVDSGWAQSLAGAGMTNPLSPAWELIPGSFIVDWFLPVGNWIASMDATLGVTFLTGSETLYIKRHTIGTAVYNQRGYSGFVSGAVSETEITRNPKGSFPSISRPRFKSPFSWLHAANALSLAVQRTRIK